MASPRFPLLLRLVPLVLLCLSPACAAGRVPVSVYYETLCPFCSAFVVNDLARIFHDGVSSIADLRLVPFGNGRVSADGSITCQARVCHRSILSVELDMFLKKFKRNFGRIEVHSSDLSLHSAASYSHSVWWPLLNAMGNIVFSVLVRFHILN